MGYRVIPLIAPISEWQGNVVNSKMLNGLVGMFFNVVVHESFHLQDIRAPQAQPSSELGNDNFRRLMSNSHFHKALAAYFKAIELAFSLPMSVPKHFSKLVNSGERDEALALIGGGLDYLEKNFPEESRLFFLAEYSEGLAEYSSRDSLLKLNMDTPQGTIDFQLKGSPNPWFYRTGTLALFWIEWAYGQSSMTWSAQGGYDSVSLWRKIATKHPGLKSHASEFEKLLASINVETYRNEIDRIMEYSLSNLKKSGK